jgi:hypothetical protein
MIEICYMYVFKDSTMKFTKHCLKKGERRKVGVGI